MVQLARREVDAQRDRLIHGEVLLPLSDLAAGFTDGPHPQRNDQPGLLGQRNEFHRRHETAPRMLPPHQGLHARQPIVSKVDRGLVVERELVFVDRRSQLRFHLDAANRLRVHLRIEERIPALEDASLTHRHGGVAQQVLGRLLAADRHGDADLRLNVDLGSDELEWLAESVHDPLHRHRGVDRGDQAVQENPEFVPTEARDGIRFSDASAQPAGDGGEGRFADAGAQAVVHSLHAVQVAVQDGDHAAVSPCGDERLFDHARKQGAIGQSGERVVERLMAQLGHQVVMVGYVAGVEDDATDFGHVQPVRHAGLCMAPRPVRVSNAAFDGCAMIQPRPRPWRARA